MENNLLIGKRIEERRSELGFTLDDIALSIGVARSTVQRYEKGNIENIKLPVIQAIANKLSVNPDWLIGKSEKKLLNADNLDENDALKKFPHKPPHKIPIIGRVSAGMPILAEEEIIGYTYTERNGGSEYFGLLVSGDSMNATTIIDGSVVIVRRQDSVDDGQVAVVMVDNEDATVKRFYRNGYNVTLMPQSNNPIHKPQIYDIREIDISIIGKVVEVKNEIE